jgi:hypothetical protein
MNIAPRPCVISTTSFRITTAVKIISANLLNPNLISRNPLSAKVAIRNKVTKPKKTRCKKPMITGLSPKTALPTAGKSVKLCRNIFNINELIDSSSIFLTIGEKAAYNSLNENTSLIRSIKLNSNVILPQIAMIRYISLGSRHRYVRKREGTVEAQSITANSYAFCLAPADIFDSNL